MPSNTPEALAKEAKRLIWLNTDLTSGSAKPIEQIIDRLASLECAGALKELLDQMHHFANCDMKLWEPELRNDAEFKRWTQSRAGHLLRKYSHLDAARAQPQEDASHGHEVR